MTRFIMSWVLTMHYVLTRLTFTCSKSTTKTLEKVWNIFKVNSKNTRTTPDVFIVNSEHNSHLFLLFLVFLLASLANVTANDVHWFRPVCIVVTAIKVESNELELKMKMNFDPPSSICLRWFVVFNPFPPRPFEKVVLK